MAVPVNFAQMRTSRFATTHDWLLVIPFNRLGDVCREHPLWPSDVDLRKFDSDGEINLYCKSSTVPRSIARTESFKVYGLPVTVVLEDNVEGSLHLNFISDKDFILYRLFSAWKACGASHKTYAVPPTLTQGNRYGGVGVRLCLCPGFARSTLIQGFSSYTGGLSFHLTGAVPTAVNLSRVSNQAEFMTLDITLKYDNYEVK